MKERAPATSRKRVFVVLFFFSVTAAAGPQAHPSPVASLFCELDALFFLASYSHIS